MQETDNIQALPLTDAEKQLEQKRRSELPKFKLGKNEGFYISREQLAELNDAYNRMISDMNFESNTIFPELRSYMESVMFTSYVRDIVKMQRENYLESELEDKRLDVLNGTLTPKKWRNWFWLFKQKKNQAAVLFDELIRRQAWGYYHKKESELPVIEAEETEADPYSVQIETLRACLPRMRKKKRAALEEVIARLAASYESKAAKLQQVYGELQAEKAKVAELQAEAKREAVKRLTDCLNAVKEKKQPVDWEILKLRQELEAQSAEETDEETPETEDEEDEIENWDDLDGLDDGEEIE